MGRSRKRTDKMNRIKRDRNAIKELHRLKKTLGLIDADGNEIMKKVDDIATITTAKKIKKAKTPQEIYKLALEKPVVWDVKDIKDDPELVEEKVAIVNEKTKVEHIFSTKTLKDQFGNYPAWMSRNKSKKKLRNKEKAKKGKFDHLWTTAYIPLD